MDITFKRVITMAERTQKNDVHNVISVLANAERVELLFGAEELDGVVIFFPDPWILKKNTSKKNRK
jgi:tRNA G46 methylase TrmB